jgi:very-short-patch-repair endonuclease
MMGQVRSITLSPRGRGQGEGAPALQEEAPSLTAFARRLRRDQTNAERLLWSRLRNRQLGGWQFKRQVPIGKYIADFCCAGPWLVVELDGGHHNRDRVAELDCRRTLKLEGKRYLVARFWNSEVTENLDSVCDSILNLAKGAPSHVW